MSSKMKAIPFSNSKPKRCIYIEYDRNISKRTCSQETSEKLNATFSGSTVQNDDLRSIILSKKSKSSPRKRKPRFDENKQEDIPKRKLCYDAPRVPKYRDHQLLGDSQLVRFTEQMLKEEASLNEMNKRYIGFCVGGQKINDLRSRLAEVDYNIHSNVIMMIGTNDIMQGTDLQWMCSKYSDMLSNLLTKCNRIVLLTVPPIPKLQASNQHWILLERFNKFIIAQEDRDKVFVIDFGTLFISYNNTAVLDYFEKTFHSADKPDLVHLNIRGFRILKAALDTLYFDD